MPFGDHSSLIYKSRSDALSGQGARPTPTVTFSNSADWSEWASPRTAAIGSKPERGEERNESLVSPQPNARACCCCRPESNYLTAKCRREKSKQATDCWNLDNYVNTGRMSYKWARRKSSKEGKKWRNSKKKPDDKGHCISISNQNGQQRQIHRVLGRNSSKQKQKGKTFRVKQQKEM